MISDLRVGIPIIGSRIWSGGVTYIELLIKALSILPGNERPRISLIVKESDLHAVSLHQHLFPLLDNVIYVGGDRSKAEKPIQYPFRHLRSFPDLLGEIDFYYPVQSDAWPNVCSASWIPDFQHIYLPEFFSAQEIQLRNRLFERVAGLAKLVVLSSQNAEKDFRRLYPGSGAVTRVMSFHTMMPDDLYAGDPAGVQHTYALPDEFLICSNQFWAHKNHMLLFEAIAELHRSGMPVHLVCTGSTEDYRFPQYFATVKNKIDELNLNGYVHILGILPRNDQLQLMRRSLAVVQPSLFEGWSTVVEDARALGKTMLLSDLDVHKEQSPMHSVYFDRFKRDDLTQKISLVLPGLKPGPDPRYENEARLKSREMVSSYALQFCSIAVEAQLLYGSKGSAIRSHGDSETSASILPAQESGQTEVKVSAIVSTYNSERFMRGCLEDLVNQTLYKKGELEIVVVDSGSRQNEKAIVDDFMQRYRNIVYIRTDEREGVYAAWNRGIRSARGKYLTNANTDDRHRKDALETMAKVLDSNPDIGLVYADVVVTATENETFEHHTPVGHYQWLDYSRELLSIACYIGPQPMWRKSLHDRYGFFDETFTSSGDWEFWLRVAEGTRMWHIPEFLGLYFYSHQSAEHRNPAQKQEEDAKVSQKYAPKYLSTVADIDRGIDFLEKLEIRFPEGINPWKNLLLQQRAFLSSRHPQPPEPITRDPLFTTEPGSEDNPPAFQHHDASVYTGQSPEQEKVAEKKKERTKGLVTIVLLVSNRQDLTRKCLDSIRKHTGPTHEIILVPCDSSFGQPKWMRNMIKGNAKKYRLLKPDGPSGFAKACNTGLRKASGEHVVIMDDGVIMTENWLSGMLEHLNRFEDAGIVGPLTVNIGGRQGIYRMGSGEWSVASEKKADTHGDSWKFLETSDHLEQYARKFRERSRHRRIEVRELDGFCMLFRHELTEKIGLFDECFDGQKYAARDYCFTAAMEGFRNIIAGDVFVYCHGHNAKGAGPGFSPGKDKRTFNDKWFTPGSALQPESKKRFGMNALFLADELKQKGEKGNAVQALVEGIKANPEDRRLHHAVAEILLGDNKFSEALEALENMPEGMKTEPGTLELMGMCKEGVRKFAEAEKYADEALRANIASARAWNLKGTVAFSRIRYPEAKNFFQKAIEVDPGYGEAYANLGALRWQVSKREEAFEFFERAFILSPASEDIVTNYYAAASALSRLPEVEKVFREAISLYPLHRSLQFILIDNLLQQNRFEEAMHSIEEAMITFGVDDNTLSAALKLREKVGTKEIGKHEESSSLIADSSKTQQTQETQQTQKPTISLCMIVKNEERNIANALYRIQPVVDEMIVVDTGSLDRTGKIAGAFGAKVFDFPWTGDFSAARNYSLSKAAGDWILVLDADEVISQKDFGELRNLLTECPKGQEVKGSRNAEKEHHSPTPGPLNPSCAYSFITRNYVGPISINWQPNDGKYREEAGSGWFPSTKVRLFPNDPRIRFDRTVHEMVEDSLREHNVMIGQSEIPVHHYGKLDKQVIHAKGEEYYEIGKKKLGELGEQNPQALYELAIQASELEKFDEALEYWKQLVAVQPDFPHAYYGTGMCLVHLSRYEEALSAMHQAVQRDPASIDAALMHATCEIFAGSAEAAIDRLESILMREPAHSLAFYAVTSAYLCAGRKEQGLEYFRKIHNAASTFVPYLVRMAEILISVRRFAHAARLLEAAQEMGYSAEKIRQLLAECREKLQENIGFGIQGVKESSEPGSMALEPPAPRTLDPSVSLCMIVKNEEENISRALTSVKDLVDEMIVVDTGSTDRTKEIAGSLGAKVYDFAWTDSFADARNFSLSKAGGNWILILDADEVISSSDYGKLRELIAEGSGDQGGKATKQSHLAQRDRHAPLAMKDENIVARNDSQEHSGPGTPESLNPAAVAYTLVTRNYVDPVNTAGWIANEGAYPMDEAGTGWFHGEKVRLFPNDPSIRFENPVHERIEPSLIKLGIAVKRSQIPVHHYGLLDQQKTSAKHEHYYRLGKTRLAEKGGNDPKTLHDLAIQASNLGKYSEAIAYLQRAVENKPDFSRAFESMGNVYYNLGRFADARSSYAKAMQTAEVSRDTVIHYAICELIAGSVKNSIALLEELRKKEPEYPKAMTALAMALFSAGEKEKGLFYIRKLRDMHFSTLPHFLFFSSQFMNAGKYDYAVTLLETAIETGNTSTETKQMLAECREKLKTSGDRDTGDRGDHRTPTHSS